MKKTIISLVVILIIVAIGVFVWFRFFKEDPSTELLPEDTDSMVEENGDESLPPNSDTSDETPVSMTLEDRVIAHVAEEFGVSAGSISIVSKSAQNWPDGCLGLGEKGALCTQAIVPGYRVVVKVGSSQYTYRTNAEATLIRKE